MKLMEINLSRFGKFKNFKLCFDHAKPIQVIYGENESGKTTFTRAFLALLFGIEKGTADAYLNDLDALLIEGVFETELGKSKRIIREYKLSRKLNADLQNYFPYLNKNKYSQHFILNDETLLNGSKDLLALFKDFNLAFYQQYTGYNYVKKTHKKLVNQSEELFKPRGLNPSINKLLRDFESLDAELKNAEITPEYFLDLNEQLNKRQNSKRALLEQKKSINAVINDINNFAHLVAALTEIKDIQNKLVDLEARLKKFPKKMINLVQRKQELQEYFQSTLFKSLKLSQRSEEVKAEELLLIKEEGRLKALLDKELCLEEADKYNKHVISLEESNKLELNIKNQTDLLSKKYHTLVQKMESLGFNERSIESIELLPVPSGNELEMLSEHHFFIVSKSRELRDKKNKLRERLKAIDELILNYSRQGKFDIENYQNLRLKREREGLCLVKAWDDQTKEDLKPLFLSYQNLVKEEDIFIANILADADSFANYSMLLDEGKAIRLNLNKLQKSQEEVSDREKKLNSAFNEFKKDWKIDSLNFESFKTISQKLPTLQAEARHYFVELEKLNIEKAHVLELENYLTNLLEIKSSNFTKLSKLVELFNKNKELQIKKITRHKELSFQNDSVQEKLNKARKQIADFAIESRELYNDWARFLKRESLSIELKKSDISNLLSSLEAVSSIQEKLILFNETYLARRKYVNQLYNDLSSSQKQNVFNKNIFKIFNVKSLTSLESLDNFDSLLILLKKARVDFAGKSSDISKDISELDQDLGATKHKIDSLENNSHISELQSKLQDVTYSLNNQIQNYITVEMATYFLKNSLKNSQSQYQQPIISKTADYFRLISDGLYENVKVTSSASISSLVCISKGKEVPLSALSHGARDQLFLSLKLALIEEVIKDNEPMPVVLDDIFVQFDEKRSRLALKALQMLSKKSQIIFLTHHRHIVELMESHLPVDSCQFHELTSLNVSC